MATVENPYEMLGEKNVSSARSETEVSFRIDDLVGEAMELVPDRAGVDRSLLADITRAVCASLLPILQSMAGGMLCKCSGDAGKVKVALQKHDDRLDEIEQYSRRDNIVAHGLPEQDGECTNDVIIAVAAAAGVVVTNGDISTSHRVGRPGNARGGKPRPIVARFVRRDTRTGILRSKKKLKGNPAYNGVFLSEQLSPMRAKLLHAVKNDADTAWTWTIDGKIFCTKRADPDGKRYVLTSPDDLFKQLGWGEDKLKQSGLFVDV